ncbi:hypothetical protein [Glaciecola sp. 1036]|uniref:hypothetical protein n=1 Tax=Alteromonadaceae TaxID=72275 RepID=UPI003D0009C3
MRICVLITFLLVSTSGLATDVKLANLQRYGSSPLMELFLMPSGGSSIADVFNVIILSEEAFTVRLIGESSEFTNQELLKFYQNNYPSKLEEAFNSSGNMHNSAIAGVREKFPEALSATTLFQELTLELNKLGYHVANIDFEKFIASKKYGISIPDVYIRVIKNA